MKIQILTSLVLITSIVLLALIYQKKVNNEGYVQGENQDKLENMCTCPCCMSRLAKLQQMNDCSCPCPMCRMRNCPMMM